MLLLFFLLLYSCLLYCYCCCCCCCSCLVQHFGQFRIRPVCRSTWFSSLKQILCSGCGQQIYGCTLYSLSFDLEAQLSKAESGSSKLIQASSLLMLSSFRFALRALQEQRLSVGHLYRTHSCNRKYQPPSSRDLRGGGRCKIMCVQRNTARFFST